MIDIKGILSRKNFNRQYKSTFGVSYEEFQIILASFSSHMENYEAKKLAERLASEWRKNKPGGGGKPKIPTAEERLGFVLYYLKQYPTFDALGALYGIDSSHANRLFHAWYPLLFDSLEELDAIPADSFESAEDFLLYLEQKGVDSLIIDATERIIQRPKYDQKEYYSGKKKRHTIKNTVISTVHRAILFIGLTQKGKVHDINLLRQDFPTNQNWFENLKVLVDLGYLGFQKDYQALEVLIPIRRPSRKGKKLDKPIELTEEQKAHNTNVGRHRIYVEHAIGGMKRFNCLVNRLRNRSEKFRHQAIFLAAGIWNFHLKYNKII